MVVYMKSRDAARTLANKRKSHGFPAKVIDNGKDAQKRYAVNLKG